MQKGHRLSRLISQDGVEQMSRDILRSAMPFYPEVRKALLSD